MKLRYLLKMLEPEKTDVYQCDSRGRFQKIKSENWDDHLTRDVESINSRNDRTNILLRNEIPRFVKIKEA